MDAMVARPLPRKGLEALIALNRSVRQTAPVGQGDAPASAGTSPGGLKSVERFRESWGRIVVQDRVADALAQGPENAGPLNSHRLVLRTLAMMQELSPAYLHQFMGHLDTMLVLDTLAAPQAAKPAKSAARRGTGKK